MKYFFKKQWKIIIIILIFFSIFFVFYNKISFFQESVSVSPIVDLISSIPVNASMEINLPTRLEIPAIKVDAIIEHVGLTSAGEMDVPKDAKNVAWFSLGTLPGAEGSAVIAGHFDDRNGRKAVFYNLKKINKGDHLFIEDSLGKIITFVVQEIRIYDSEAFAPEIFSSNEGQYLNLITCTGAWSKSQKRYKKRLVVFTNRVD